jgi:hypothetical protein
MLIMWTCRQILVVLGLIIQFIAVIIQVNKVYNPFKSKYKFDKESKKWIVRKSKMSKPIDNSQKKPIEDQITEAMKNWLLSLILIFVGLVLQGIAEFV